MRAKILACRAGGVLALALLIVPGTTKADPLFDDVELRALWPFSMTNACRYGCSDDKYELQPIFAANSRRFAEARMIGMAQTPYYLVSKKNPHFCGSAGCQSVVIAIDGDGVKRLYEDY